MLTVSSYGSIPSSTIWIPSAVKVGQIWKGAFRDAEGPGMERRREEKYSGYCLLTFSSSTVSLLSNSDQILHWMITVFLDSSPLLSSV